LHQLPSCSISPSLPDQLPSPISHIFFSLHPIQFFVVFSTATQPLVLLPRPLASPAASADAPPPFLRRRPLLESLRQSDLRALCAVRRCHQQQRDGQSRDRALEGLRFRALCDARGVRRR
jgi:hypothetical protein